MGDADRGYGRDQPGGWVYSILAFIEEDALRQLPADGKPDEITQQQMDGALKLITTPVATMICPTRRSAALLKGETDAINAPESEFNCRTDYGASAGSRANTVGSERPKEFDWPTPKNAAFRNPKTNQHNGICYQISNVNLREVTDGSSKTYAVGEKYVNPDNYESGTDTSYNNPMFMGDGRETMLHTTEVPLRDTPGIGPRYSFGSAHPGGWNVAFCDGSVRMMSYDIDALAHRYMGVRNDGENVAFE